MVLGRWTCLQCQGRGMLQRWNGVSGKPAGTTWWVTTLICEPIGDTLKYVEMRRRLRSELLEGKSSDIWVGTNWVYLLQVWFLKKLRLTEAAYDSTAMPQYFSSQTNFRSVYSLKRWTNEERHCHFDKEKEELWGMKEKCPRIKRGIKVSKSKRSRFSHYYVYFNLAKKTVFHIYVFTGRRNRGQT